MAPPRGLGRSNQVNQQDIDVGKHRGIGFSGLAVERKNRQPADGIDAVGRLNHVVLFGTEKTMLGGEQTAQLPWKMLQHQVAAMAKLVVGGRLVAEQTQPLFFERLRWCRHALFKTDPDFFLDLPSSLSHQRFILR